MARSIPRARDTDESEIQAARSEAAFHASKAEQITNIKRHQDGVIETQARRIRDLENALTHYQGILRCLAAVRSDVAALAPGPPVNEAWADLTRLVTSVWAALPKKAETTNEGGR